MENKIRVGLIFGFLLELSRCSTLGSFSIRGNFVPINKEKLNQAYYLLNIPPYFQAPDMCGVFASKSVLDYYRADYNEDHLTQKLYSSRVSGTRVVSILNYFNARGDFTTSFQTNMKIKTIISYLSNNIPVIFLDRNLHHFVLIIGFNKKTDTLITLDGYNEYSILKKIDQADVGIFITRA